MVTTPLVLTLAIFFAVFAVVLGLRYHATGKAEPRLADALLALVPAVLTLLVSGYVQKLVVGPDRVEIEVREAFLTAGRSAIAGQVSELPFLALEEAGKGGIEDLEQMVERKVEVLSFVIGTSYYVADVVRAYFERLGNEGFFRFVLFKDVDGRMQFACAAQPLIAMINSDGYAPAGEGPNRFVDDLERGFIVNWLSSANFCVAADGAVETSSRKGDVLAEMERRDREWLPVTNGEGRFAGVVYRSRLTSSVLVDVLQSLRQETAMGPDGRPAAPASLEAADARRASRGTGAITGEHGDAARVAGESHGRPAAAGESLGRMDSVGESRGSAGITGG